MATAASYRYIAFSGSAFGLSKAAPVSIRRLVFRMALIGLASCAAFTSAAQAQPQTPPWGSATLPSLVSSPSASVVRTLQQELNRLGYDAGPADGIMGARTRSAIRSYQRSQGLLEDGEASAALLNHVQATAQLQQPPGPVEVAPRFPAQPGFSRPPSGESADMVTGIQRELRRRGYSIPGLGGEMNQATREAIRDYQRGSGLAVTGEPSQALLDEMRSVDDDHRMQDLQLTREERAEAQRALNARGYNAGPPDGVLSPLSRSAIERFQRDSGLEPTGRLTQWTRERLGVLDAEPEAPPVLEPEYRVALQDNFSDGDFTRDPAWRIASGRFTVRNGGLSSSVAPPSDQPEDIGRQILGSIFQEQLGMALPGQQTAAAAYVPTRIAPGFRIVAELSGSSQSHGNIQFGPYFGRDLNHGYRLVYRSDQSRPLQLQFVDQSGASVLGSSRFQLDDGSPRLLEWTRDVDGRMTVSHSGETLIEAVDREWSGDFDGFSLINAGGDWALREVTVEYLD